MLDPARLVTAEELEKFPDDDFRYELVAGCVIRMSPVGYLHGRVVTRVLSLLDHHVRHQRLGVIVTEVGFKLKSNPDTVRAPDIAFIRRERIPTIDPRGFWKGPPDLAIEVLSPADTQAEVAAKTADYLSTGVPLVVIVDPEEKTVSIHSRARSTLLRGHDDLDLAGVISVFRCQVDQIFE